MTYTSTARERRIKLWNELLTVVARCGDVGVLFAERCNLLPVGVEVLRERGRQGALSLDEIVGVADDVGVAIRFWAEL